MEQRRALEIAKAIAAKAYQYDENLTTLDPSLKRNYSFSDNDIWVVLSGLLLLKMNYNNILNYAAFAKDVQTVVEYADHLEEIMGVYEKIRDVIYSPDWEINIE
jgi:hypothetical protein